MELRDALSQIAEIRHQMARTEVFRGYRALPVAFSGLLALMAACVQPFWVGEPRDHVFAYLSLWIGAAIISAVSAGVGMFAGRRVTNNLRRELTWLAIEQFVPAIVAGGLITLVFGIAVPEGLGFLPGLWQVLFSLGVFASCRLLPRATFAVGVFYLVTGVLTMTTARSDWALSPWSMGLPFGAGQLLAAAVLYWTLERVDGLESCDA